MAVDVGDGSAISSGRVYAKYSCSTKIVSHLDHISRFETTSDTNWSNGGTYRVLSINARHDSVPTQWACDRHTTVLTRRISQLPSESEAAHLFSIFFLLPFGGGAARQWVVQINGAGILRRRVVTCRVPCEGLKNRYVYICIYYIYINMYV